MIWTREQLLALSEADFRDQVVIPLFKAMGYQDVRSHHGGVLEQGKDVVMYRVNDFGTRRNSAVVIKAERIGGSASTLAGTALTQILQALGSTFLDPVTREECRVHGVLLVNSHDISTEALQSFKTTLAGSRVDHQVDFIWGDLLWGLLRKHLPRQLIFESVAEAQRALAEADPHYGYVIQIGPGGAHFMVVPQSADAPPLQISFEPKFPDTEEGRAQLHAFERFLRTGQSAEINRQYLTIRGLPPSADFLVSALDSGSIRLGPTKLDTRLVVALILAPHGSEEVVLLPHLEFGTNRGGSEEVTISNDQQNTPFKIAITFRRGDRLGRFNFNFAAAQMSAFTQHRGLLIQALLSQGGMLLYEDLESGSRHRLFEIAPGEVPSPGEAYVELWGHVAEIQRRTGTIIPEPSRPHFTDADVSDVFAILAILQGGSGAGRRSSLSITMSAEGVAKMLGQHRDGVLGELIFETSGHTERVLDTDVSLGPVRVRYQLARIPPAKLDAVMASLEESGEDPNASIIVPIEAVEGHEAELTFTKWSPRDVPPQKVPEEERRGMA